MFDYSILINRAFLFLLPLIVSLAVPSTALAQGSALTYQGRLTDSGNPADGLFDMQFKLFNTATVGTGTQHGPTITNPTVQVTNGVFTVELDFGAGAFDGSPRFLEIGVRPTGSTDPYPVLSPRQPVAPAPWSLISLKSNELSTACVGCVQNSQINSVAGNKVSGEIPVASVPAGSGNYIQNSTSQQAAANFSIGGNGTAGGTLSANAVNAATQFNINGSRVLSVAGATNLFAGISAGAANTSGNNNVFFGNSAGQANTSGNSNAFFGHKAGALNTASFNSFFGAFAGDENTAGSNNSFFGNSAGGANQTGGNNSFFGNRAGLFNIASFNSFFGASAGDANTTGSGNSFFGNNAGAGNQTGFENTFVGRNAGTANTVGDNNTTIGDDADVGANNLSFATAIGAGAVVSTSNTVVLGRSADTVRVSGSLFVSGSSTSGTLSAGTINAATQYNINGVRVLSVAGTENVFAGIGAGAANTTGSSNAFFGARAGEANTSGGGNSFFGNVAGLSNQAGIGNSFFGYSAGRLNQAGDNNSFFGYFSGTRSTGFGNSFFGAFAGDGNTIGQLNAFFGNSAGVANQTGSNNAFFGAGAGMSNSSSGDNAFFGFFAGSSNTASNNSFFGALAGDDNTTGTNNAFFGKSAGRANQTGNDNAFFGHQAGALNTASSNSFFGAFAGDANTTGGSNAFFGASAGRFNTANSNSFFGAFAGSATTTGDSNSFFGSNAGNGNQTGNTNTIIGSNADVGVGNLSNATAIGASAQVDQSDSLVLGSIDGVNGATATVNVGIGTTSPSQRLHVVGNALVTGSVTVNFFAAGGILNVCRNSSSQLATCSSSLRYKEHLAPFAAGLELINRLRPITFTWKQGGVRDLGLVAEEVAEAEPLLVTYNERGQVEGVKYDRIAVVLINAVREQQELIRQQQAQIDELKKLACKANFNAGLCK